MAAKFVFESPKEVDKLFKFPINHEENSDILNFLKINKFPPGIDVLIAIYVIDEPWLEFVNAFLNKNSIIAIWLRKIFNFRKLITRKEIQETYETKICLAEPEFQESYKRIFGYRCDGKYHFQHRPFTCFATVLKNNNPNYKSYIQQFNKQYDDEIKHIFLAEMINYGCIDALRYAIEEVGWKLDENYLTSRCNTDNQNILKYLYSIIKKEENKDFILFCSLRSFDNYIRQNNDIKKVTEYCESHIDIIRKVISNLTPIHRHPAIACMIELVLNLQLFPDAKPEQFKTISAEIIIYLIKTFPLTPTQIKEHRYFIVNYSVMTQNTELLKYIESIIGCKFSTLLE